MHCFWHISNHGLSLYAKLKAYLLSNVKIFLQNLPSFDFLNSRPLWINGNVAGLQYFRITWPSCAFSRVKNGRAANCSNGPMAGRRPLHVLTGRYNFFDKFSKELKKILYCFLRDFKAWNQLIVILKKDNCFPTNNF